MKSISQNAKIAAITEKTLIIEIYEYANSGKNLHNTH